jgi:signal transduction histidine kinase/CheY-like chemotaxis protein
VKTTKDLMKRILFEYKFTALYLLLGLLWIVFSDRMINSMTEDHTILTRLQTYKGWFYVLLSGGFFFYYLRSHLVRLRDAEKKAVESDRLKSAFLQNISHEIRTPMNGIIGFATLLENEDPGDELRKEYLGIITNSSNRLLELVNQILDISMLETGTVNVHPRETGINRLLLEVYEQMLPHVKPGVEFRYTAGLESGRDGLVTDEYKLRQIVGNLVHNAVKFTSEGSIEFGYTIQKDKAIFFVNDTGPGIPQEKLTEIFKYFRKAEDVPGKFHEGAGLGLAICKGNLQLMNGWISVKSEQGKGARFTFEIPYTPSEKGASRTNVPSLFESTSPDKFLTGFPPKAFRDATGSQQQTSKPAKEIFTDDLTILVAEDEIMNYRYMSELLKDTGIRLLHAANGEEAVEIFKKRPDIGMILMDIRMPVMNGFEAMKRIRGLKPDLPIIAQSAYISADDRKKTLDAGFNEIINKPFLREELLEVIEVHSPKIL